MNVYFLGEYIKKQREKLGLIQEQVCEGICEQVTLSRLENGRQTPSRTRVNALLQRLGLPEDRYYMILTKNELEIEALKKEIIACNALDSAKEGFSKVEQLEKLVNTDDNLEKQFILRSKALLGYLAGRYTKEEKLRMLIQAIGLTIPDFDLEIIGSHLYTVDEMKIINQIAGVYSDMGQNKKAADIYYQLLKYVQKHQQEAVISSGMLPMVLGNYARALDLCGYYKDAVDYAQRGIEACVRYGHYQMLYACLAIQAESYHFMKQDEKSAEAYHEAYYLCKVIGRKESMLAIQEEAKNYIGLEFRFK